MPGKRRCSRRLMVNMDGSDGPERVCLRRRRVMPRPSKRVLSAVVNPSDAALAANPDGAPRPAIRRAHKANGPHSSGPRRCSKRFVRRLSWRRRTCLDGRSDGARLACFRRVRGFGGALGGRNILAWKQGNDRSRDRENRHQGRAPKTVQVAVLTTQCTKKNINII